MKISVKLFDRYLTVEGNATAITAVNFTQNDQSEGTAQGELLSAVNQLKAYASGQKINFKLNCQPKGTPFQQKVWQALYAIPYGETRTYGQIAKAIDAPKASRAVGGACHNNPISIIVACHRVVGVKGLTGYFGGLDLKAKLLDLERK